MQHLEINLVIPGLTDIDTRGLGVTHIAGKAMASIRHRKFAVIFNLDGIYPLKI